MSDDEASHRADSSAARGGARKQARAPMSVEEPMSPMVTPKRAFSLSGAASTWGYAIIFLIAAVLGLLFRYTWSMRRALVETSAFDVCDRNNLVCVGNQAVYRLSFSLAVFFLLMLIVTLITPSAHKSWWMLKLLIWAGLTIGWFFIPGEVFIVYSEIARVLSFFYIIIQILVILNMAYALHEALVKQMDENSPEYDPDGFAPGTARFLYLLLSGLLLAAAITGIALLFVYYGDCDLHNGLIGMTLALTFLCVVFGFCARKGILAPIVLSAYNVMICYQALQSNPDLKCNPRAAESVPIWQLVIMIAFNLISICWSATRAAQSTPSVLAGKPPAAEDPERGGDGGSAAADRAGGDGYDDHLAAARDLEDGVAVPSGESKGGRKRDQYQRTMYTAQGEPRWWTFHLVMFLAAVYLAMLLTGWGAEKSVSSISNTEASKESLWIKIASIIAVSLLYLWTVVAPLVCTSRDFS